MYVRRFSLSFTTRRVDKMPLWGRRVKERRSQKGSTQTQRALCSMLVVIDRASARAPAQKMQPNRRRE